MTRIRARIEKLTLQENKDGKTPSILDDWEDEIFKEDGVNRFWEHVAKSEHKKHPVIPTAYDSFCIYLEVKNKVAILEDSILKFKFKQGSFPLLNSKLANSQ